VLVVEDERLVRETAVAILRGAGFEAVEAASAEEALRTFDVARDHIDLLLTDVVMPGMSGVELARRMRAARSELRVLFVSGYPGAEFEPGDDRNADRVPFLQKPYAPDTLVGTLRELLDARKTAAPRRD
jgi:CheY-like chemotaxis protein